MEGLLRDPFEDSDLEQLAPHHTRPPSPRA